MTKTSNSICTVQTNLRSYWTLRKCKCLFKWLLIAQLGNEKLYSNKGNVVFIIYSRALPFTRPYDHTFWNGETHSYFLKKSIRQLLSHIQDKHSLDTFPIWDHTGMQIDQKNFNALPKLFANKNFINLFPKFSSVPRNNSTQKNGWWIWWCRITSSFLHTQ